MIHPRLPRSWSLRSRLVAMSVVLTAIALVITDLSATFALRSYLIGKVDDQLTQVASGPVLRLNDMGLNDQMNDGDMMGSGRRVPSAFSVTLLDPSGKPLRTIGGGVNEKPPSFAGITVQEALRHGAKPWTWHVEGANDHRIISRPLTNNQGVVVVSLSLADANTTLIRTASLIGLVGILVLLLLLVLGRMVIAVGLRPLTKVEETAEAIAAGDLSARIPDESSQTEVGRITRSLNRMLERIEESFKVKEESETRLRRFVADASHELRTPLTAVRGFSELHRQGAITGEVATTDAMRRIEREAVRMSALVEDLLLLARLDQQRPLELETVDLRAIVDEVVEAARVSTPNHPIAYIPPNSAILAQADALRLNQAISNLLVNARTHTPAGTPIAVALIAIDGEAIISVSDQGPGLTEEQAARIFERFYRADASRTRTNGTPEGSGLGLSIVDAVMKAHGGSADVVSRLGEGATFILRLPLLVEE